MQITKTALEAVYPNGAIPAIKVGEDLYVQLEDLGILFSSAGMNAEDCSRWIVEESGRLWVRRTGAAQKYFIDDMKRLILKGFNRITMRLLIDVNGISYTDACVRVPKDLATSLTIVAEARKPT